MKKIYKLILGASLLATVSCTNDLDQAPDNQIQVGDLTTFEEVLNAGYFYHRNTVSPLAVMGDFRADNGIMFEEPFPAFDRFDSELPVHEIQFFLPFYDDAYQAIISANGVIEQADDATAEQVGEAQFLRALAYFKLVQVFGDVPVNLLAAPDPSDLAQFTRQPAVDVYNNVIIPDLLNAISNLDNSLLPARASRLGAQSMLGKVYMHMGDYANAEPHLAAVVNNAAGVGVSLQADFADVFDGDNELNSEIIVVAQVVSTVVDQYTGSEFWEWFSGSDTKAPEPLDPDLISAFNVSESNGGGTDLRRAVTIDEDEMESPKYNNASSGNSDWIELRLADVMLLYAEALNENGASGTDVLAATDAVRLRAGLTVLNAATLNTQPLRRQAIQDERRLELAFEGKRWFDLVRTGTVDAEMGQTINSNYHVFPIPLSETNATNGVITQNPGY